ncbi:MAG TPA: hypothetical protein VF638_16190 [Sphingomonas sp.]|jgi:hypothetical protein
MIKKLGILGCAAMVAVAPVVASARAADVAAGDQTKSADQIDASNRKFAGLDFGIGLSFSIDIGVRDRIAEASIVDGLVRIDDENNDRARVMLESHYFFTPGVGSADRSGGNVTLARWGVGPFVALQPGTDEVIEAIGMGVMVGFRRGDSDQSFNVGVGYVVDPNTRVLGDGIVKNQPLPGNEEEIRFKDVAQTGWLILTSFSF